MASLVTRPEPVESMPMTSGRMLFERPGVVARTLTRPEPAVPPRKPAPASRYNAPRFVVLDAVRVAMLSVLAAVPAVRLQMDMPSRFVTVLKASVTAVEPPRKPSWPPRIDRRRSAVVVMMLVVPPSRFETTFVELSRVSAPPSVNTVVTKPSLAEAPDRTTEPPWSCRVSRIMPELSPVSVQAPAPILVMLSLPEV